MPFCIYKHISYFQVSKEIILLMKHFQSQYNLTTVVLSYLFINFFPAMKILKIATLTKIHNNIDIPIILEKTIGCSNERVPYCLHNLLFCVDIFFQFVFDDWFLLHPLDCVQFTCLFLSDNKNLAKGSLPYLTKKVIIVHWIHWRFLGL